MKLTRLHYQILTYIVSAIIAGVMSALEMVNAQTIGASVPHQVAIWVFNFGGLVLFVVGGGISEKNKAAAWMVFCFAIAVRLVTYAYIWYQLTTGLFDPVEIGILFALNTLILFFEILLFFWSNEKDETKQDQKQESELIYARQEFRAVVVKVASMAGVKIPYDVEAHTIRGWLPLIEAELRKGNSEIEETLRTELKLSKETIEKLRKGDKDHKGIVKTYEETIRELRKEVERLKELEGKYNKIKGAIGVQQRKGAHYLTVDKEGLIWSVNKETGKTKGDPGKLNGKRIEL